MTMARSAIMQFLTIISVAAIFCFSLSVSKDSYDHIGNTNETEVTPSRAPLLYLDTENPATASGNITSFRVCYYEPKDFTNETSRVVYRAVYAVYRKISNDSRYCSSESYVRVSKSFSATVTTSDLPLKGTRDQHIYEGFNCYDDVLDKRDSTAFLSVEQGDVLGACILDPRDFRNIARGQLDIVGEESGHSLMQTTARCCLLRRVIIPRVIPVDHLSAVASKKLHLYANISKELM